MPDPEIISLIRKSLVAQSDPAVRKGSSRFFKEAIKLYGVKVPAVQVIAKQHFRSLKGRSKKEIFSLCEFLLKSGYWEEAIIAFNWAYSIRDTFVSGDFAVFERWISSYVGDWAECDTLCNHTVGAFIDMYPVHIAGLKKWAKSGNMWLRRAAAVSLILPAREGKYLDDILEIADMLLVDKEDLVQKGYGWMLKEASRKHQREVFEFIMKNRDTMPRTALRYAIEKMPLELKSKAMQKSRK